MSILDMALLSLTSTVALMIVRRPASSNQKLFGGDQAHNRTEQRGMVGAYKWGNGTGFLQNPIARRQLEQELFARVPRT